MANQSKYFRSLHIPASLLAASLLVGCGDKSASEYIASAQSYIKQDDRSSAIIELKNALKQEPKNAQARRLLGESYLSLNQAAAAEKELVQAQKLGAQAKDLYPSLIRALNLQGKYQELVDLEMPKGINKGDEILANVLRGIAYFNLQKPELAQLQFEVASQIDSKAPFSQLGQAYSATASDNFDHALNLLSALIEKEAKFTEAYMLKAKLLMAKKEHGQALEVYKKLIELDPKNFSYQLQLAKIYLQQSMFAEARDALSPVSKRFPKHPYSNLILAELEFREGNFLQAKEAASQVLAVMENSIQAKYILGLSSFKLNENEQAHRYLSAVEALVPQGHSIRKTIATIEYQMGYLDQAASTLLALKDKTEDEAKLLEAIGMRQAGKRDFASALNNLQQASALDPENHTLKARIGVLKLAEKDDSGLADLDAALSGDPSLGKVKLYQALYFIEKKEYDKALAIAKKWQANEQERVEGYNVEALVYLAQAELEKATALFEKSLSIEPANKVARNRLAGLALQAKDYEVAKGHYLALLKAYPQDTAVHISLAGIAIKQDDKEQAIAYFADSLKQYPKAHNLRVPYIQLLASFKDYQGAMAILEQSEESQAQTQTLLQLKGDLFIAMGKNQEARQSYQAAIDKQPKQIKNWLKLLGTYKDDSSSEGLEKALAAAKKQLPESLALKKIEIVQLISAEKYESALQVIDKLRAKPELINWADELESAVYFNAKDFDKALLAYKRVLDRQPTESRAVHYSTLLDKVGKKEEAKQVLSAWIEKHDKASMAEQALAILLHNSDPAQAEAKYRAILKDNPNNVAVLNNLAWSLAERGETQEALTLSKRAADLAPNSAAVLDTHGFALLADKQYQQAIPVLEKASKLNESDLSIQYHLAKAYYHSGQKPQAKTVLEAIEHSVKQKSQDFAERQAALELLKKL